MSRSGMKWRRPASVPVGQVWSRFKGRERDGVPAKMYQIRDMDEKYKRHCLELMLDSFLRDESLCKVLDIKSDPVSVATIRDNWEYFLNQNISIACFTEEDGQPDKLVGFNILIVKSVDDDEEDTENVKGEQWKKLLKTLIAAEQKVDIFKHYGVDKYLTSSGLTVDPKHRGQNLGARIFEARKPLSKALGLAVSVTVFTAKTSQVLAKKCGYETLSELDYKDMLGRGVDLTDCDTPSAITMGIRFDFDS